MAFKDNEVLSTAQAAQCLGWSKYWLRVRAKAGDIPYFQPRPNASIKFIARDIAAFRGCKVEEL